MNVTTYICPQFVCGIQATKDPEEGWASTQASDGQVVTALMPGYLGKNPGFVYAKLGAEAVPLKTCCPKGEVDILVQSGFIPRFCAKEISLDVHLEVDRFRGDVVFCGIEYDVPTECDWFKAAIFGQHYGKLEESWHGQPNGPIPLSGNKDEVINLIKKQYNQNTSLVPGERISLVWYFKSAPDGYEVAWKYFTTKCFTGGWVSAISGDPQDPETIYTVCVEGKDCKELKRSDFFPYEVGDWVTVLREPNSEKGCIEDYTEDIPNAQLHEHPLEWITCPEFSGKGLIVPMRFHNIGPVW